MKSKQKTFVSIAVLLLHAVLLYGTYQLLSKKPALKSPVQQHQTAFPKPNVLP
jgi:hypothetical protein